MLQYCQGESKVHRHCLQIVFAKNRRGQGLRVEQNYRVKGSHLQICENPENWSKNSSKTSIHLKLEKEGLQISIQICKNLENWSK